MIIKCSHCAGKMRVDESRIPKGQRFKIRCPHCKGIGVIQDQPTVDQAPVPEVLSAASGVRRKGLTLHHGLPAMGFRNTVCRRTRFTAFAFPRKEKPLWFRPPPARRGLGIVTWILVSLGIVAFFALLVNIILSGPGR